MHVKGIYIDDGGTPGAKSKSVFLPADRKSYCAVIIPEAVYPEVLYGMTILLNGISNDYGADEIHCTDIYSNRGPWNKVSIASRIEIFDFLTSFFINFQLPVVFNTRSHHIYGDHPKVKSWKTKSNDWWDFQKIEHLALLALCSDTHKNLREFAQISPNDFSKPFPTFIDEGLVKANSKITLPNWGESFLDMTITSVKSKDCFGIQLADFAAFCISRTQWIMAKTDPNSQMSDADIHICSISGKLNSWNAGKIAVNPKTFSRDDYESIMKRDRREKGLKECPT